MKNLTLIVPTHNRHHYLTRSIAYFQHLDAEVIYCDSSIEQFNRGMPDNIKYLHLPEKSFAEKVMIAIEEGRADYVALCADDDFILIETLYEGLKFLADNNQFVAVVGRYVYFNEPFDGLFWANRKQMPKDINTAPKENAKLLFSDYYQILWALYRKEVVKKAFEVINTANAKNDNFIEHILGSILCYSGGVKFINSLWGVRERTLNDHWAKRHISIPKLSKKELSSDLALVKKSLDQATFAGYTEMSLNSYLQSQKLKENKSFSSYLKILIPSKIKSLIRKLLDKHLLKKKINLLDNEDILKLQTIREILEKYPGV